MDITTGFLISCIMIQGFVSLWIASAKTGYVIYSYQSLMRHDQPRFEVDKTKVGKFVELIFDVFLGNVLLGLIALHDIREIQAVLLFGLMGTVFSAYGLSFLVLLKEKKITK